MNNLYLICECLLDKQLPPYNNMSSFTALQAAQFEATSVKIVELAARQDRMESIVEKFVGHSPNNKVSVRLDDVATMNACVSEIYTLSHRVSELENNVNRLLIHEETDHVTTEISDSESNSEWSQDNEKLEHEDIDDQDSEQETDINSIDKELEEFEKDIEKINYEEMIKPRNM